MPRYSDTADDGIQAYNQGVLDDALAEREEARNTAALWTGIQSTSLEQLDEGDTTDADRLAAPDQLIAAWRTFGPSDHGTLDLLRGDLGEAAKNAGLDATRPTATTG